MCVCVLGCVWRSCKLAKTKAEETVHQGSDFHQFTLEVMQFQPSHWQKGKAFYQSEHSPGQNTQDACLLPSYLVLFQWTLTSCAILSYSRRRNQPFPSAENYTSSLGAPEWFNEYVGITFVLYTHIRTPTNMLWKMGCTVLVWRKTSRGGRFDRGGLCPSQRAWSSAHQTATNQYHTHTSVGRWLNSSIPMISPSQHTHTQICMNAHKNALRYTLCTWQRRKKKEKKKCERAFKAWEKVSTKCWVYTQEQ